MYITADTLDDLLLKVFNKLLKQPFEIKTSRKTSSEIFGVMLKLNNPRARLSLTETKGKPFSAIGELLWYLKGSNSLEFIRHYIPKYIEDSEDNKTIYGAYGTRIFRDRNQFNNIVKLLRNRKTSRRAVIQLFEARDLDNIDRKEIPCTCSLQFLIRENKLYMITYMRSNDAFWGLPHDIFAFTMLQEILARELSTELGTYKHMVGSLHLYEDKKKDAKQYRLEGYQARNKEMKPMPAGSQLDSIKKVLRIESRIRKGEKVSIKRLKLPDYWKDIICLIQIHYYFKQRKFDKVKSVG